MAEQNRHDALVRLANNIAGADAIALAERKIADLRAQIDAYPELSTSLACDDG